MPYLPLLVIQNGFYLKQITTNLLIPTSDDFGRSCVQLGLPVFNHKLICKRIYKSNAFQCLSVLKVFTKNHRNLVEPGTGPKLSIAIGKLIIAYTPRSFQHDLRGEGKYRKGALPVFYLLEHFVGLQLYFRRYHAKKFTQALHT